MIKVYKELTDEQKKRGVIFSSCLSEFRTEIADDRQHEVFKVDEEDYKAVRKNQEKMERLKDDKFFNNSHFNFNIIRT